MSRSYKISMVTLIYQDEDGVYRASRSGRRIKGDPGDSKKYQIVGPEVHREHRMANIRAAAARLGRVPRSEAHAAGEAGKPIGIREERDIVHEGTAERYAAKGVGWDAPDKNTVRMIIKLRRHNPAFEKEFHILRERLGANYFKYNPVSHSFEMYNHRQVYKGSYQLPVALRSKKVEGVIQHYERRLYRDGPTTIYHHGREGLRSKTGEYVVRPPGPGRYY